VDQSVVDCFGQRPVQPTATRKLKVEVAVDSISATLPE
jgi:hypothetical protein